MSDLESEKILGGVAAADFVGRANELKTLLSRAAADAEQTGGVALLSAPASGASELLRQTFDWIFTKKGEMIPVYFAVRKSDRTARRAALRFVQTFLQQTIAFRRRDRKFLERAPDFDELAELATAEDAHWIDRTIAAVAAAAQSENELDDERLFVRNCLTAPLRASAEGARVFLMFDNLHEAANFTGETDFIEEIKEIYARSEVSFVFSGHRRFLYDALRSGDAKYETIELMPLNFADAGVLTENLAKSFAVEITDQTRDLIVVETAANPLFILNLIRAASEKKLALDNFRRVGQVYTDELFGGSIGKYYDAVFSEISPNTETQKNFVNLLYDALTIEREKTPVENWKSRTNLNDADFYRAIDFLNAREIVRLSSNLIEAMPENEILSDYIRARFRLETIGERRAAVVGEMLSDNLKRAPQTMARFYRQNSALGLRELLSIFDCQPTPVALFDYSVFSNDLKGAADDEILDNLNRDAETIRLPQIVYTAHTEAFYPPINQVAARERSAVAVGFDESKYTDADETVWIAAEIDSKLEASSQTAEFWCDRLEMVALMCNFLRYKIWLVAPEGFSPEASEILRRRNAFGSSRRQVSLLVKFLKAEKVLSEKIHPNEYEIVVPMGDDTELIAAHAVEDIARRSGFKPKAINQIKTALVEACINATEHSLSPDRKIYQKFAVEDDRIIITISNRGLRLNDKKSIEIVPDEGRRGWGLKLMRTLMDEVKFEQVDDGTRISMVKNKS